MNLPPALAGDRFEFGGMSCYMAGNGPPLLLVHSVNAAASAAEVRPLFDHFAATRTVFAVDLPGFGFSERSDRPYDPWLMTNALQGMATQIQRLCGCEPIDALACSLGCEFLARAAVEQPDTWGALAFVSPTGLNGTRVRRGPPGSTRAMPLLHSTLSVPLWSNALYRGLTHPAVIRYFLERTWGSKSIDETLWSYDVATARQPGARFAPLHFIAGSLFSDDIHDVYEKASQPVWMSRGVRGDFADYRSDAVVRKLPNWKIDTFQTGALPYFEVPHDFFTAFNAFLQNARRGDQRKVG
ncbi:MAG: alpha/beta hydrolase [Methylibium sp. NZG]|nr:MAG: alpha/beta hydrolase [Methylibium sp. NZG]